MNISFSSFRHVKMYFTLSNGNHRIFYLYFEADGKMLIIIFYILIILIFLIGLLLVLIIFTKLATDEFQKI